MWTFVTGRPFVTGCIIGVLALVLRLALVLTLQVTPSSDALAYHTMATNLLVGTGLRDVFGNLAYYNPGYPIFALAPVYALFGANPEFAQILNAILGAVSAVLVFLLTRRLLGHCGWAAIAGFLFAIHVEAIISCEFLAKENLSTPVLLGSLLAALLARQSTHPGVWWGLSSLLAGIALLTGTSSIYLLPALVLVVFQATGYSWPSVRSILILVVGIGIVIAPWMARNAFVFGDPVFSTSGGFNLYLGNNPSATGAFVSIGDTPMGERWHELRKLGEVTADRVLGQTAFEYIAAHPVATLRLSLTKIGLLWNPPWHYLDPTGITRAEFAPRFAWFLQYFLLLLATIVALVVTITRGRSSANTWPLWVMLAGISLIHAVAYVIPRYRLPVEPVLIILGCYAGFELFHPRRGVVSRLSAA